MPPRAAGEADAGPPAEPARAGRRRWVLLALLVVVLAAAVVLLQSRPGTPALTQRDVDRAVDERVSKALEEQQNAPPVASVVYQAVLPSLVQVVTQDASGAPVPTEAPEASWVTTCTSEGRTAW